MILVITGAKRSLVVRGEHTKLVGKYQTANFFFYSLVSKQNVMVVGIVNVRSRNTHQRNHQRRPIQVSKIKKL